FSFASSYAASFASSMTSVTPSGPESPHNGPFGLAQFRVPSHARVEKKALQHSAVRQTLHHPQHPATLLLPRRTPPGHD
ncbi:MAG: hypothetical protein VX034_14915, partial [Planctomycetota bacterium]|nr:hypothetical protein [Planctomycetota bacterium]